MDLVGAFKSNYRESDNQCIIKSTLFVDTYQNANQSGDIAIPIENGIITPKDIQADLFDLCKRIHSGRKSNQEITLFKSVGYALEDLVTARYYYNLFNQNH